MPVQSPFRGEGVSERPVTFTREQIAEYAEASGDHNPIHLDEEFARTVGLPGVIAHGMLQMGLLASLLTHELGDQSSARSPRYLWVS